MTTSPERGLRRHATLMAATLVLAALAGCTTGGGGGAATVAGAGPAFEHVHGLGLDPADDSVYVATHDGLFRSGASGMAPVGATGRDLMGFTSAGPGILLSSGHPAPDDELPNPVGLVESRDGGVSWTPLSLTGEVDFHALEVSSGIVFGYDAIGGMLRASTDGGRTWEDRAALAALDIAVNPSDPTAVLATTEGGVVASRDGGRSFAAPNGTLLAYVSWASDGTVYGIGLDGAVFASTDAATTWQQVGVVPGGRPQAITATGDVVLAATAGGVFRSDDGGATFNPVA